jgi:hypothetical protein
MCHRTTVDIPLKNDEDDGRGSSSGGNGNSMVLSFPEETHLAMISIPGTDFFSKKIKYKVS